MKSFSGVLPDAPLRCGCFPSSPLPEKIFAPSKVQDHFIQVGQTKAGSGSINPQLPVFDQAHIRSIAKPALEDTSPNHYRRMIEGVSSRELGDNFVVRSRQLFCSEMFPIFITFATTTAQNIYTFIGREKSPLQIEALRETLVVRIHPREVAKIRKGYSCIDQFVQSGSQTDLVARVKKIDRHRCAGGTEGVFRASFCAINM